MDHAAPDQKRGLQAVDVFARATSAGNHRVAATQLVLQGQRRRGQPRRQRGPAVTLHDRGEGLLLVYRVQVLLAEGVRRIRGLRLELLQSPLEIPVEAQKEPRDANARAEAALGCVLLRRRRRQGGAGRVGFAAEERAVGAVPLVPAGLEALAAVGPPVRALRLVALCCAIGARGDGDGQRSRGQRRGQRRQHRVVLCFEARVALAVDALVSVALPAAAALVRARRRARGAAVGRPRGGAGVGEVVCDAAARVDGMARRALQAMRRAHLVRVHGGKEHVLARA
mmetsp:Transcript_24778/g.69411  ORF Transcript_24778/g.69411 Transcript_24778/m.69411 type:complete len:283 (+) Transcript_24778:2485-3333(+)